MTACSSDYIESTQNIYSSENWQLLIWSKSPLPNLHATRWLIICFQQLLVVTLNHPHPHPHTHTPNVININVRIILQSVSNLPNDPFITFITYITQYAPDAVCPFYRP